jgi:unsaturated rhamnogalacturonyl hydrolase
MPLPRCLALALALLGARAAAAAPSASLPAAPDIVATLRLVNDWYLRRHPDSAAPEPGKNRPSNAWTRAVYDEGLMALYGIDRDERCLRYAQHAAESRAWGLNAGPATRHADNQCIGQTYLDLYALDPRPERIRDLQKSVAAMVAGAKTDDWWWADALQMAMPVFARLGVLNHDPRYLEKMYALYADIKTRQGGSGLYNPAEHLWWRDHTFLPPYREPNGANCYWARGNGWVLVALARVLEVLPPGDPHRAEYIHTFQDMSAAIRAVQRPDGFWNVSLKDPGNFGGKEVTGTSLFVCGLAAGVRLGFLPAADYEPAIAQAWNALAADAVHPDGALGYLQGVGKQPSDSQPVSYDHIPDIEDFGVGCFLLGGVEVEKLAGAEVK